MTPDMAIPRPFCEHIQIGNSWERPWGWTSDQAAEIAAVPPRQVAYWVEEYMYLPSCWTGVDVLPWFTLGDILCLRLLRELMDASVEAWTASAMVENLASSYSAVPDDADDWFQPQHLDVRAIARGDDWLTMPANVAYIQATHKDPNEAPGLLQPASAVEEWTPGVGRFRTHDVDDVTWWAWPISAAARDLCDHVELWCRRHRVPRSHLGAWQ